MSKTVDFSKFPNIALVEEIDDDMGGGSVVLHFRNGTKLHICPDDDAVNFTAEGDPFDEDGHNRLTILFDLDSGQYCAQERSHVTLFAGRNMSLTTHKTK